MLDKKLAKIIISKIFVKNLQNQGENCNDFRI